MNFAKFLRLPFLKNIFRKQLLMIPVFYWNVQSNCINSVLNPTLTLIPILQIHQVPFCESGQQSTFFIFTATSSSLTTSVISFYNTKQKRSSTHAIEKFLIGASRHFRAYKLTDTSCEHITLTKTSAQNAWLGLSPKPCGSTSLWVQQSTETSLKGKNTMWNFSCRVFHEI